MGKPVYAPPAAPFGTARALAASRPFYVVSANKFAWLFFLTVGMYEFYWHYKNWDNYKQMCKLKGRPDGDIWPVARALFTIFFVHQLFYRVSEYAEKKKLKIRFPADRIAAAIVVLILLLNGLTQSAARGIDLPYTLLGGYAVLLPLYYFMNIARKFINAACGDAEGRSNAEFTVLNYVWMALGAICWILMTVALLLPELLGNK